MLIQEKGRNFFVRAKNTAPLFDYDWNFDERSC